MKTYHFQTEHKVLLGDLHTPTGTYLKVRDLFPQSILLESSDYHGTDNNRSFIGLDPIAHISINHNTATAVYPDGTIDRKPLTPDFTMADAFNGFLAHFHIEGEYAHYCGLYGYTAFNAIRYLEPVQVPDSCDPKNDAPDAIYILYRYLIVFQGHESEMVLVGLKGEGETGHIGDVERAVNNRNYATYGFRTAGPVSSPLTDDEHRANIRRGIAHCLKGDVFQIVLSRRFVQRYEGDDFAVYRALRSINPSPYLFYFDFGGYRLFGSSPETHCKVCDGYATIDPIAGTTRRTGDPVTDRRLADALLADPKENAEHTMLVDLARNDLARNCKAVDVETYKEVQFYSHVIHLVSRVSGKLRPGADPIRTFLDTFPAGTLSGAPKVRAMQLISEIEPHNRGAYGGCVGFIGFNGYINQAIIIRTFVSRNSELWFQAGGGIVAKSDVEAELQEVNNKLGALRRAIELAERL
ncbi:MULTISPECIES: anthranilate synthase component I family protein [Mediterranea]|uniref:anthranilate synthase component I family protein n=1 Tax=Mediterranea TaxID=1926659 RepID=UPI0020117D84|nr:MULTISPECIES: anthranilate synthase component I family protein [Mediterranea]MCL1607420.1 anthranilate synthase component I family protein [Mediterranea sp. ET5]MDM8122306.1 anthranilate synthase component I family protein [Mediterranea massiliensis]MDM8198745.1 anthranilate synthase component I family protein [Mediterranea massiliensis]